MSDDYAKFVEKESVPSQLPAGQSVSVSVMLHPNGQVEFSLPNNFVLAHGLLGMASAKLMELQTVSELKRIQAARGGLNGLLHKMGGG